MWPFSSSSSSPSPWPPGSPPSGKSREAVRAHREAVPCDQDAVDQHAPSSDGVVAPLPAARHRRSCPSPAPVPPLGILALLARLHPRTPRTRPRERGLAPQQRSRSCTSSAHQLQQQRAAKPTRRSPVGKTRVPPRTAIFAAPGASAQPLGNRSGCLHSELCHALHTAHTRPQETDHTCAACAARHTPERHAHHRDARGDLRGLALCALRRRSTHALTPGCIQPLASPRATLISCAALYQLHHASLGAVFATQTPPHPGGNPAQKARPMATTVLRYCVLSLVCHVGFAEVDSEAVQQECLFDQPDEIRLDFSGRFALAHPLLPARSKRSLARDRRLQAPRCAATTSVDKVPAPSCALLSRTTGNAGSMTSTPLIRTTRRWVRHCIVACLPHWPMHAAFQVVLRCGSFRQCHGWKDLDETRRCGGPRHHRPDPVRPACELSSPVHYALHAPAHAEVARPFTRARLRP